MRRAVFPPGQGGAPTRPSLSGVRVALGRAPVEADALWKPGEELEREVDVALDHPPDRQLVVHREVGPYLVEQRPRGPGEIAPVVGQTANRPLAGVEHLLLVPTAGRIPFVLDDAGRQLPVDRAAEAIHLTTPCGSPFHWSSGHSVRVRPGGGGGLFQPAFKPKGRGIKRVLRGRCELRAGAHVHRSRRVLPSAPITKWTPSSSGWRDG